MPTPHPETDMLHMQHAHVVALLARQSEAARLKGRHDAAAKARRAAASAKAPGTEAGAAATRTPTVRVRGPRPA